MGDLYSQAQEDLHAQWISFHESSYLQIEDLRNYYLSKLYASLFLQACFDAVSTVIIAITGLTSQQARRFMQLFIYTSHVTFGILLTVRLSSQSSYRAMSLIYNPDEPSLNAIEADHFHLEPFEAFLIILQSSWTGTKVLFYEYCVSTLYLLSVYSFQLFLLAPYSSQLIDPLEVAQLWYYTPSSHADGTLYNSVFDSPSHPNAARTTDT